MSVRFLLIHLSCIKSAAGSAETLGFFVLCRREASGREPVAGRLGGVAVVLFFLFLFVGWAVEQVLSQFIEAAFIATHFAAVFPTELTRKGREIRRGILRHGSLVAEGSGFVAR